MNANVFPVCVIICDAWHTPTHYSRFIDSLTRQGFPTACPQLLTSHTEESCTSSFNDDCSLIYQLCFDLCSDGHNVIAICHGYGGFVASEALGELSKATRIERDLEGGIVGLVALSAFLPDHGQKLKDCYGGNWPDNVKEQKDGRLILYQPGDVLFNDLGSMEREHWSNHLVRFTAKAHDIILTTESPAWKHIQTTYIICDEDLLYPEDLQRKALNTAVAYIECPTDEKFLKRTGHCAMISAPEEITAIIVAAASEAKFSCRLATYDGADGADGNHDEDKRDPCQCGNGSEYAGACDSSEYVSESPNEEFPREETYRITRSKCTHSSKYARHHKERCRYLSLEPNNSHPNCPCLYENYSRESFSSASTTTSASETDPLSSREKYHTVDEGDNFQTPEDEGSSDDRDPYESWETGLATIGSAHKVETAVKNRQILDHYCSLHEPFEKKFEDSDQAEVEGDVNDSDVRSDMIRSDASGSNEDSKSEPAGVEPVDDEEASTQSDPEQGGKGKRFIRKMARKATALSVGL